MPDITMCRDEECSLRKTCYRHEADPNILRQSYFVESPREDDGSCKYYWRKFKSEEEHADEPSQG